MERGLLALTLLVTLQGIRAQNTWTQKADFGGTVRVYATAFSIGSKGYIGTGLDGSGNRKKDFWEYDPSTNVWTQKADFGGTARSEATGFSIGTKGYIGTGGDGSVKKDFWEYDPTTNGWTQKADFGGTARFAAVGFSTGSKGYIGTGNDLSGNFRKDFWEYDPATNAWTQKADFGGTVRVYATGFSIGSKGYIGNGLDGSGDRKKDFWEYNPAANAWTQKADFGGTVRRSAVGFSIGTKGYIGTGLDGNFKKDFWEYDPATNGWTQKADFGGTVRVYATGFSIGSKGYIGTGADVTNNYRNDFWEYTPVSTPALVTYYPRTSATDLSQVSNWTDAVSGTGGNSPSNFTSPNQLFNVNGNVTKPSVLGAWTISGGSNLVLNNTDSLLFRPQASLTIGAGSTADFNGKPVTLKSTAAGTAFIGQITGSLTNATAVTVERYISSLNNRAYRLLAPSVNTTSSIRANWQEGANNPDTTTNLNPVPGYGTHITGSQNGINGFDADVIVQASLFTYNPMVQNWDQINNTNTNTLYAKRGYLLLVRGDRSIDLNSNASPLPSNNTTLRATGSLLTGTQTFAGTVAYTDTGTGFNLVTNPYASPINWQSIYNANTGIGQAYTLFDPNIGAQGGYVTVNIAGVKSIAGSNATVNIQSGQAFFVQATGTAPTVTIQESHKSTQNNVDVFRTGSQTEVFSSSLFYTDAQGRRINADGVTTVYNNAYSAAVDGNDADQIANFDEDIAIRRSGHALSIESRPLVDLQDTIFFALAGLQTRNYVWEFTASGFNAPGLKAHLLDRFLNTQTPVSLSGTTVIAFTATSDVASKASDRFAVVFAQGSYAPLPLNGLSVKAAQKNRDVEVEWTVQNEVNIDRYEVEKSTDARTFSTPTGIRAGNRGNTATYNWLDVNTNQGANYYRIKAMSTNGEVKYSSIVRVDMGKTDYGIAVYPNPISGGELSIMVNLPKGKYTLMLINAAGQRVYQTEMTHPGGAATQTLHLDAGLAQGAYQLRVADETHRFTQPLFKQQ